MNIRNAIGVVSFCFIFLSIYGCEVQESRPSYDALQNVVSSGTKTMKWNEHDGLLNVDELVDELNDNEKKIFTQSLEWLGTESNIPLSLLSGRTAAQVVDIANCLKSKLGEPYELCVGEAL